MAEIKESAQKLRELTKVPFVQEFKAFILRGNVFDLATGVIIGAAFGKIVNSLIADVIMPPIGLLIGGVDFKDLKLQIGGTTTEPVTLNYGLFIQNCFEFLIVATVIFMLIKLIGRFRRLEEVAPSAVAAPPRSEVLLAEIRDLLANKK